MKGWVPFDRLKKVSEMSLEELEWEIQIRGYGKLISTWETKSKGQRETVRDVLWGNREMTKEYYCRNTLRDLREKTVGLPIPAQKRPGPEPTSTVPINPTQKPNPAPSTNPTLKFKVVSGENNPSKKMGPPQEGP